MPQIVNLGKELVRINTQKNTVEYSQNEGRSWVKRLKRTYVPLKNSRIICKLEKCFSLQPNCMSREHFIPRLVIGKEFIRNFRKLLLGRNMILLLFAK